MSINISTSHSIRKMTTAPFLKETVYSWMTNGTMMVQGAVKGAVTISPNPLSPPTLLTLNSHKSKSFISHKQLHKPKRCLTPNSKLSATSKLISFLP